MMKIRIFSNICIIYFHKFGEGEKEKIQQLLLDEQLENQIVFSFSLKVSENNYNVLQLVHLLP